MAKTKKIQVPHNVKERFRHQNLQRLLENVASQVPHLPALKNETKAKKLRRIVLYMRFLLQKHAELPKDPANHSIPEIKDMKEVMKEKEQRMQKSYKVHSEIKSKSCHPQIVFLRKISDQSPPLSVKRNAEATCTKESELDCNYIQEVGHDHISFTNNDSSNDFIEPHHESASLFGNFAQYSDAKQPTYEFYTPGESEVKTNALGKHASNAFARPWERNMNDQKENAAFGAQNPAAMSDEERNAYHAEINDFNEKCVAFRNSTRNKLPPSATYIPSRTRDDHADQEKYPNSIYLNPSDANDDMQKDESFSQDADNFQFEFFSSGESAQITSSGETAPVLSSEWLSSDEMEYGNMMEKAVPALSNSENIPLRAPVVEDSFDSCDIYNNPVGPVCDMEQCMDLNQDNMYEHYGNLMPDFNLGMISSPDCFKRVSDCNAPGYEYFQSAGHHTEDNFSRQENVPDYFRAGQGCKEDRNTKNIPKQVNNHNLLLSNKYLSDLQDGNAFEASKYAAMSGCKGYPTRLSENCSSAGMKHTPAWKYFGKPDDVFVPHESSATIDLNEDLQDGGFFGHSKFRVRNEDLGCQENEEGPEFGHSSFRVGSECLGEVKVKQEDIELHLLADEISYSLNNLNNADWYGEYF